MSSSPADAVIRRRTPVASVAPQTIGVAASLAVEDVLRGPERSLVCLAAGPRAAYLRVDGAGVVALEASDGAGLPNAVILGPGWRPDALVAAGRAGVIGGRRVAIARTDVTVGRWWDPAVHVGRVRAATIRDRADELTTAPTIRSAQLGSTAAATALRDALLEGGDTNLVAPVAALVGRGPGSTPAGDDVLAGLLVTLRVLGRALDGVAHESVAATATALAAAIWPLLHRTTPVSAALLECADQGFAVAAARRVLRALAGRGSIASGLVGLAAVGHTSGAAVAWGIEAGCATLIAAHDRSARR